MLLAINKMSLSNSTFTLNNSKRKRNSNMVAIAPLLQRIKKSLLQTVSNQNTEYSTTAASSRSLSEKSGPHEFDEKSILSIGEDDEVPPKFYALSLERHSKNYVQPVENWWSSTPPLHQNTNNQVMIC